MAQDIAWDLQEALEEAEFVLAGIGEEFQKTEDQEQNVAIKEAYDCLARLLKGKVYFIVNQNTDELMDSSDFLPFMIAAPLDEGKEAASPERWNSYLNWLTATLNHKLLILELGVGFGRPQIIRWPFEKTLLFNWKAKMIRVNGKFPQLPEDTGERGMAVRENAVTWLLQQTQMEDKG